LGDLAARMQEITDWSLATEAIAATAEAHGVKPGRLMFPLRVALSRRTAGPALNAMLAILGKEESIRRIELLTGDLS
ncbi:MAG: glutamate--tRNA ligase, partial [Roseibacillus sp.]|nr:glutamate--tRNA ligase [Roseibacillus sp.]